MKKTILASIYLFLSCLCLSVQAQNLTVTGKVIDANGVALPGVTVIVKGTTIGAPTGPDGNYSLVVPDGNGTLVFSYISYQTQEVPINNRNTINVTLSQDLQSLEEVVIVGYGSQRKDNVTGSIATVNTKELLQSPVSDLSNALTGRVPGVITKQPAGQPGADAAQIYIRGNATFGNGTMEPLFVVDGIVRSYRDFSQMDPNEIESVNVLKDASSAAIFGVKGANGVVLVTTKRGKMGKITANYGINYGFSEVTRLPKSLGSYEYGVLFNEAKLNDNPNATPEYSLEALEGYRSGVDPDLYPNTDWMDLVLGGRAARLQQNFSLSGGSERVNYFASLGYLNEDGLYKSLNYKRYNVRSNLDFQATSTTRFSVDLSGRLENRTAPPSGNIFEHTMRNPPVLPAMYGEDRLASPGSYPNPLALVDERSGYNRNSGNFLLSNFQVVQDIPWIEGLSVKGVLAFDRSFNYGKVWNGWVPLYGRNPDGTFTPTSPTKSSLSKNFNEAKGTELQAHLNYENRFGRHGISALALVLQKQNENSGLYGARNSFESSALEILNFGPGLNEVLTDFEDRTGLRSAAARINYDFDSRYILQLSLRRDESENFAPDKRTGYFPAVSAGWLVSNEPFMEKLSAINFLKIKASYGKLGSDRIPSRFGYYNRYDLVANNYPFGGILVNGLRPGAIANPNVTWETSTKTDVGLETRLFGNLLGLDVTVFQERRENILATRSLSVPLSFGAVLPAENFGIVENKGIELALNHENKISKNWSYYLRGNFTYAKNKILEAAEAANVPLGRRITGRANNGYFGYQAIGIFRDQEDYDSSPKPTAFLNTTGPGDIKYQDISGENGTPDGKIDEYDITYLGGGSLPEVMYGLMGGLNFKGLEISVLFQGATQVQQLLIQNAAWAFYNSGRVTEEWLDRWTPLNQDASLPRLSLNANGNNNLTSSFWVRDATYLRLKNAEVAYNLPTALISRIHAGGIRIFATGQNLLTVTDILNVDPENTNASGWYYPQQRTFTVGMNVQF